MNSSASSARDQHGRISFYGGVKAMVEGDIPPTPFMVVALVVELIPLNLSLSILVIDLHARFATNLVMLYCSDISNHSYRYGAPRQFSTNYTSLDSLTEPTWYPDSIATHHIINGLSNLNVSI